MDEKQPEPATRAAGEPRCPWGAGATLPGVAWSLGSSQAQHPLKGGYPMEGAPLTTLGAAGCWKWGAGICQSRSIGEEKPQDRTGSSLHQPPSIRPASP